MGPHKSLLTRAQYSMSEFKINKNNNIINKLSKYKSNHMVVIINTDNKCFLLYTFKTTYPL